MKINEFLQKGEPYITLSDNNFQVALRQYTGKIYLFEGILYDIQCLIPSSPFAGQFYIGKASSFENRYREHLLEAIKIGYYVSTTHSIEVTGWTKINQAFVHAIESPSGVGVDIRVVYDLLKRKSGNDYYAYLGWLESEVMNYMKPRIFELHDQYETLKGREKHFIKSRNTVTQGMNEIISGGGTGRYYSLPIYDIVLMSVLGTPITKIVSYLTQAYPELRRLDIGKDIIYSRIKEFIGSSFRLQEKFLKPVMEFLQRKHHPTSDIYQFFSESLGKQRKDLSYFSQWVWGEAFLEGDKISNIDKIELKNYDIIRHIIDEKGGLPRYSGISLDDLVTYAIEGRSLESYIPRKTGIPTWRLRDIYKILSGTDTADYALFKVRMQRLKAIQLIEEGGFAKWPPEKIFQEVFTKYPRTPLEQAKFHAREFFINELFPEFKELDTSKENIIKNIYAAFSGQSRFLGN